MDETCRMILLFNYYAHMMHLCFKLKKKYGGQGWGRPVEHDTRTYIIGIGLVAKRWGGGERWNL